MSDDDDVEWDEGDPDDQRCHYCGGVGWGVVVCDRDSRDPSKGPYDGDVVPCPCCGGSGKAEDCTFW